MQDHYRALEQLFFKAQINSFFPGTISVGEKEATLTLEVEEKYFHTLGSLHGAVYFKLLDDATAYAALSLSDIHPYVTASFTIDYFAPVTAGMITATGRVVRQEGKKVYVEGILTDDQNVEVAKGTGLFLPAKMTFADIPYYKK